MLVLAILWLPVLVVPLVTHGSGTTSDALNAIGYLLWALFMVEYLVKLTSLRDVGISFARRSSTWSSSSCHSVGLSERSGWCG